VDGDDAVAEPDVLPYVVEGEEDAVVPEFPYVDGVELAVVEPLLVDAVPVVVLLVVPRLAALPTVVPELEAVRSFLPNPSHDEQPVIVAMAMMPTPPRI
jgi:hypothetical protein